MKRSILALFLFSSAPALAETPTSSSTETPVPAPAPAPAVDEAPVAAPPGKAGMDDTLSAFGLLSYWYTESGVGVGARYQKTIAREGVLRLPTIHDDIGLEGGVDYVHYSFGAGPFNYSYNEIAVLVGAVWNFWFLDDRLALYPKIDLGYRFGSWSGTSIGGYGGLIFQGSAGVAYRLSRLALRAEAGSGSLRLGAGFSF